MKNYKKILIFQTAFIGDVVLVTSLIREAHKLFPNALIDAVLIPSTANILSNNPYLQKIHIFNKKDYMLINTLKTILTLRKEHYDLVLSPHHSNHTGFILFMSAIKTRVGFGKWSSAKYFNVKVEHFRGVHKLYKILNLLSPFTKEKLNIQTELFPSTKDKEYARQLVSNLGDKKILIAPGSVWHTKCWPLSAYTQCVIQLLNKGYSVILSGSPTEKKLCDKIINHIPSEFESMIINCAGKTNLIQSSALVSEADLVLCNDSGTLHIANAMQVTVFAIFGPTLQRFGYYPYREKDYVFEIDLECRPCGTHGHKSCPLKHHKCMENIEVSTVINKIETYFKSL